MESGSRPRTPKDTAMNSLLGLISAAQTDETTVLGGPKLRYAMKLCRPVTPQEQENLTFELNRLREREPNVYRRVRTTLSAAATIVSKKR